MKQIKFKQLATFGLCCSLLVNSLTGVTAVAETVTIESSPTAESSVKEETTKASTETSETTTETSREGMKEQETEEFVKQEVVKEKVEQDIVAPSINKISPRATVIFPESIFQIGFVDEKGALVAPENFSIKYDYINWEQNDYSNRFTSSIITPNVEVPNVNGLKQIVLPAANIAQTNYPGPNGAGTQNAYRGTAPTNFSISIPKYYENLSLYDQSGNISPAYPLPIVKQRNNSGLAALSTTSIYFYMNVKKKVDGTYTNTIENNFTTTTLRWPIIMERRVDSVTMDTHYSYYSEGPVYYHLTNRKVTENFKDVNGTAIPAPTGFTQGKKTSITNNDYTFTQGGILPNTYTANNGKAYKFKGWYKGKTEPATLEISKTPSYAVTYDDNDDLNVVYEEVATKAYTLPSEEISFGYVDEKGELINPANFTIEAELGDSSETETTVLSKIYGTNDTSNMLKKLAIPGKSYTIPEGSIKTYGTRYVNHTIPKYYKTLSISPTATYTGDKTKYPMANEVRKNIEAPNATVSTTSGTTSYRLSTNGTVFGTRRLPWSWDTNKTAYAMGIYSGLVGNNYNLAAPDKTIYYYLENRRVTENFVDSNGTKITPPTGFTQGKQTVIDSENFTYTSAKALPDTYTVGDKNYKFKGWYKGTDQTKMETTKTPSYAVTYDDKDDMTAVYEEVQETAVHPGFYAEFVDEQGQAFTNPLTLSGNYTEFFRKTATSPFEATGSLYPMVGSKEATVANRYKVETKQNVLIPNDYELFSDLPTGVLNKGFALNNFDITNELKYVDKVEATTKTITLYDYETISDIGTNLLSDSATTSFTSFETVFNRETNNTFSVKARWGQSGLTRDVLPSLLFLTSANSQPRLFGFDGTSDYKQTINYKVTRKQVTENFVDATGAKITPPTGFTQGKQTPMTSNSFTYTSAKALPATYTVGDKNYKFKGWYKGTDKTALKTTKTPSYAVTYDDKDDMTAVYEEVQATAEMTVSRLLEVVSNEASMIWTVRLKNTSEVPLTNVKLAPTAKWAAGISAPTQLAVRLGNTPNKIIPVTAEQWRTGVNLGVEIPVNGEALVTVNTAKITGEPRQLLTAEMTASGNFFPVTASNFVRIQGEDQTIEPTPAEEGFISTPTFDFGKIMISGSTKQYGLKKAADYYGNGTRNPYLRIKKSQPNWQLTAQLSQLKASADSLPTSTRLLLGNADVATIENYNQVTELTNKVGITEPLALTSDGTSTPVILNNQFTGNDVYQLDFDFANVKLEVPANQGKINEKYQGTVTWNLVTGP